MCNITLISTIHSELGKCNSDELQKIIASIDPQVIFEELSKNLHDVVYGMNLQPNDPLEIKCIKKYLETNSRVKHIPVDSDASPLLSDYHTDYMFDSFEKHDIYEKLLYEEYLLAKQDGFAFLNSEKCCDLIEKRDITIMKLLEVEISNIYKLFIEQNNNRENEMLQNIYNYSKENQYDQAVFLLGVGHRKSITQKITKYNRKSDLKLNWTFYDSGYDISTHQQIP